VFGVGVIGETSGRASAAAGGGEEIWQRLGDAYAKAIWQSVSAAYMHGRERTWEKLGVNTCNYRELPCSPGLTYI